MQRIDAPGATLDNRFTEGNPVAGIPATEVSDDWLNSVQEEICTVIEDAGITLDPEDDGQLLAAIQTMIANSSLDTLNTTRVSVASATTVDLTTAAPNTRHINLTGTATIVGFTVAAGRCYFVRAAAGCVLANGANLTTQRGTSITCAAGDTFILRATAANTVEVLCYVPAAMQGLGYNQKLQNVRASRTYGVNYTNNTGRPIWIHVRSGSGTSDNTITITVTVGAETESVSGNATGPSVNSTSFVSTIIPPGGIYQVNGRAASEWKELR